MICLKWRHNEYLNNFANCFIPEIVVYQKSPFFKKLRRSEYISNTRKDFGDFTQYNSDKSSKILELLVKYNAKLISKSKRGNKLYSIQKKYLGKRLKLLRYTDPSTGEEYLEFVPEHLKTADDAMSWKFYLTEVEYGDLIDEA